MKNKEFENIDKETKGNTLLRRIYIGVTTGWLLFVMTWAYSYGG